MTAHKFLFPIFLLTACPDPTETPSTTGATDGTTTQPQTPSSGGNFESDPNEARVDCSSNECVTISGKFNTAEDIAGRFRVDVQKVTQGSAPRLVHTLELQAGGDFSFELPKDFGDIVVTGFVDQTGDGPTPDDAQGRTTIEVKSESISDISLDVALGNAPPPPPQPSPEGSGDGAGQPPTEGENTAGTPEDNPPAGDTPNENPPAEGTPVEGPPSDVPADNPPVDGPPPDDAQ